MSLLIYTVSCFTFLWKSMTVYFIIPDIFPLSRPHSFLFPLSLFYIPCPLIRLFFLKVERRENVSRRFWEAHKLKRLSSKRQLRGSGEDGCRRLLPEHVPQSSDMVSQWERSTEQKRRKWKKQRRAKEKRERDREKELGQLVIHYGLPIIHSGPSRLVLCCSLSFIFTLLLKLFVSVSVSRQKTHQAVF